MKPQLSNNPLDVGNFDPMFTAEEAKETVVPAQQMQQVAHNPDLFKEFDQKP